MTVPQVPDELDRSSAPPSSALATDPEYRAAVVDLLGVLAYGELAAFERMAADGALAPTIDDESAIAELAVADYRHFVRLRDRLRELEVDPQEAMAPFKPALDAFHGSTQPNDYLEGMIKAYVGDGIGSDFYREITRYVDDETRAIVLDVCADSGRADFIVDRVRAAIDADPRIAGRLALWARRLMGEALSQAQHVAAQRDALSTLLVGGTNRPGADLGDIGRMLARLAEAHTRRMQALGLTA